MASTYDIRPYKLPRVTEPIPTEDNKCFVCWKQFGVAEEDDDPAQAVPACEALQPDCGHYIGSQCFLLLLQSGRAMACSLCQTPYPRAEPSCVRKLAVWFQSRLFLLELGIFEPIKTSVEGFNAVRAAQLELISNEIARGEAAFDLDLADEVFRVADYPVAIPLTFMMPTCLLFQCITILLKALLQSLQQGIYTEAWIPSWLIGYQMADTAWIYDLAFSFLIAMVAHSVTQLMMVAEENLDMPDWVFPHFWHGVV